ncbi:MAG: ATPase, partial [Bacteroidia bacterium]|nr:ATPase [Bacteroidia bacterium]
MTKYLNLLILFFLQIKIFSVTPVLLSNKSEVINIRSSNFEILEDKENIMTIKTVVFSKSFVINNNEIPNFGISKSAFWLKFQVKNTTEEKKLLLMLAYPNLDEVELYEISHDFKCSYTKMGKNKPFFQRNYQNPGYVFDITVPLNKTVTYFLKIKSGGQIMVPISIGAPNKVLEEIKIENFFIGIYCGIILIMFFYNLFIFYAVRDKVYLYYVGYILIVGLVQLSLLGYAFQFFWPNSTWLAFHSVYLLSALVGISAIEFIKVFLQTKIHTPFLHKGFFILNLIYISYIVLDFLNFGDELYNVIQLCAMFLSFYMIFVAFKIAKKGSSSARFFLLAWTIFLVGVFIYAMKDLGILPYNNLTIYTMPAGSAIEAILLSFALADRINILKKEKEESQATALLALQENEKLITEQNIILEQKVHERTIKLESTNEELNATLSDLKDTQAQLVNAEKMASLGQLTAGIAHEINNPINFVSANVKPLKMDIEDVLALVKKYETLTPDKITTNDFVEIEKFRKQIDIDYLKKEMESLLMGIEDGAKRTAEIVSGLKNFSRLDESDVKEV